MVILVLRLEVISAELDRVAPNSAIEADEALGRFAPSGLRSLMPVVGQTTETELHSPGKK
jgi:hypothetical protein